MKEKTRILFTIEILFIISMIIIAFGSFIEQNNLESISDKKIKFQANEFQTEKISLKNSKIKRIEFQIKEN